MSARNKVFHEGPLLHAVQKARIFKDSKTFVDMPLRRDPSEVLMKFRELTDHQTASLRAFVSSNFCKAGSDFCACELKDWQADPAFLARLSSAASAPEGLVCERGSLSAFIPSPLCPPHTHTSHRILPLFPSAGRSSGAVRSTICGRFSDARPVQMSWHTLRGTRSSRSPTPRLFLVRRCSPTHCTMQPCCNQLTLLHRRSLLKGGRFRESYCALSW